MNGEKSRGGAGEGDFSSLTNSGGYGDSGLRSSAGNSGGTRVVPGGAFGGVGAVDSNDDLRRQSEKNASGANVLKDAERAATGGTVHPGSDGEELAGGAKSAADEAGEAEENPGGFWRSENSRGRTRSSGLTSKFNLRANMKKYGPLGGLLISLVLIMAVVTGSQSTMMFSLAAQVTDTFNSMQTPNKLRSNNLLNKYLKGGLNSKYSEKFKFSEKQTERLAKSGIEVDDDFNGSGRRALKFEADDGKTHIVIGDDMDISDFDAVDGAEIHKFSDLYDNNVSFHREYSESTMGWRGAISNWFNQTTTDFLKRNSLTRNLFANYIAKNDIDSDSEGSAFKIMADHSESDEISGKSRSTDDDADDKKNDMTETDANGDSSTRTDTDGDAIDSDGNKVKYDTDDTNISLNKNMSEEEAAEALTKAANNAADSDGNSSGGVISTIMNVAVEGTCTAASVLGALTAISIAQQTLQVINVATHYLESIDKVKAGDGNGSPINELGNSLTKKTTTTYKTNANDGTGTKTTEVTGSAMEAAGIASLYGGFKVNANDTSVKSFNLFNTLKTSGVLGTLGVASLSGAAIKGCSLARAANATASAIEEVISFAGGPVAWITDAILGTLIGAATSALVGQIVSGIVAAVTPFILTQLSKNFFSPEGGEDLGNAIAFGSNSYLGNTHRGNGGSLATSTKYTEFALAQQEVLADNAKYERETKDPMDATSKYTFLGTIVNQFMAFSASSSLVSSVSSATSVLSNATIALMPDSVASAYNIADDMYTDEEYAEMCPFLSGIGAVGDAACNPYAITDVSTLNYEPDTQVADVLENNGQIDIDDEGNASVVDGSDLAKYIVFCDNRESAFGIVDYNIQSDVANFGSTGSSIGDAVIGALPFVGDAVDIVQSKETLENMGYITGESCVAGNDSGGAFSKSPSWDSGGNDGKHYQRFIEDQSYLETTGAVEKSAVTAFTEKYYEEHPLDNSYAGILARYSGLLKEDVVAALEAAKWMEYIADYESEAGERDLFGDSSSLEEDAVSFGRENSLASPLEILALESRLYDFEGDGIHNSYALVADKKVLSLRRDALVA